MSKWVGTLAPTILFGIVGDGGFPKGSFLILVLGIFCSVFDLTYSWMLFKPEIVRTARVFSSYIQPPIYDRKVSSDYLSL